MGEDARGIVPIIDIAGRFGAIESDVCEETHEEVIANYLLTSREMYESELKLARSLIKQYRTHGSVLTHPATRE
jgi:hypothetical protein